MASSKPIIAVFGSTGAQGGSVVKHLARDGRFAIRAITRKATAEKAVELKEKYNAELVEADMSDPSTYDRAFSGAYGAFVVTAFWDPSSMGKEKEIGRGLVKAAKAAGVQHFVWSTLPFARKESEGKYSVPHFDDKAEVDDDVRAAGFPYHTLFAAAFYFQNFSSFFPVKKGENGDLSVTIPDTSSITAYDVSQTGGIISEIFNHRDKYNGKYIAASADHVSLEEVGEVLSKAAGKRVSVNRVPREVFAKFGFPGAHEMAEMFSWFNEYTYYGLRIKRESGLRAYPPLRTLEEYYEVPEVVASLRKSLE